MRIVAGYIAFQTTQHKAYEGTGSMTIQTLDITSTRGANKRPSSGYVTFSDGKNYYWGRNMEGEIFFGGWRVRNGENERFSFKSPARASLIEDHLNH